MRNYQSIKDNEAVSIDMVTLGYIVQYSNEEEYTVYHGFVKLYRKFSDALEAAKLLSQGFMEMNDEAYDGPFKSHTPTKQDCDAQGSALVFESPGYIVWIDCVVE